jgi:RNA polymerase primary sigma factor
MEKRMIIPDETSLELYLKEISRNQALSAEEEQAQLAVRIKVGDKKALEKLIKANLRFVSKRCKKLPESGSALGELISEGNLGLIQQQNVLTKNGTSNSSPMQSGGSAGNIASPC